MNSSLETPAHNLPLEVQRPAVLAREAGVPFQPAANSCSGVDPIAEWLSLMEVVQMLCPIWPVREKPMQGDCWRL